MKDALNKLAKSVGNLFTRAVVTLVDDTQAIQFVQARINSLESVPQAPRVGEYGAVSNPPVGSEAILIFPGGSRTNGLVIGTSNAKYRMKGLKPGEYAIHNHLGVFVYLSEGGLIVDGGGLPVTLTNTPKIRAETTLFQCTGDIVDNCDTTGRSMAADREIFDGHFHAVPDIQEGSDSAQSDPPTQQE